MAVEVGIKDGVVPEALIVRPALKEDEKPLLDQLKARALPFISFPIWKHVTEMFQFYISMVFNLEWTRTILQAVTCRCVPSFFLFNASIY